MMSTDTQQIKSDILTSQITCPEPAGILVAGWDVGQYTRDGVVGLRAPAPAVGGAT